MTARLVDERGEAGASVLMDWTAAAAAAAVRLHWACSVCKELSCAWSSEICEAEMKLHRATHQQCSKSQHGVSC
jgi:hypothetical protein